MNIYRKMTNEVHLYENYSFIYGIMNQIYFIKKLIIEKVRDFLFELSEEIFNEPLENIDDMKIIEENNKKIIKIYK